MNRAQDQPEFSRMSVALFVCDVGSSVAAYAQSFHERPAACRQRNAQFVLDQPSLTLDLIEDPDAAGHLTHVALETSAPIASLCAWLTERDVQCDCHDDHAWLEAPDELPWLIHSTQNQGAIQ